MYDTFSILHILYESIPSLTHSKTKKRKPVEDDAARLYMLTCIIVPIYPIELTYTVKEPLYFYTGICLFIHFSPLCLI